MIKTILFDFFGVIGNDVHWTWLRDNEKYLEERKKFYQELSNQVDLGQINENEFIEAIAKKVDKNPLVIKEEMDQLIGINAQVVTLLVALYKHYKIGLISSSHHELLDGILDKYDLRKYFRAIIISSRVGLLKSNKKLYDLVVNELGVKSNEILYIDDHKENVTFAKNLGFHIIWYKGIDKLKQTLIENNIKGV